MQKQVEKLVQKWQVILGLTDWSIEVAVKRHWEMDFDNTLNDGLTTIYLERKKAIVWLLDKADKSEGPIEHDVEHTVIHELLHVVLFPYSRFLNHDFPQYIEEQIINGLAQSFADLGG